MNPFPEPKPLARTTDASPDLLPMTGYTMDQLIGYIKKQLGEPTWNVELTNTQIGNHINDALIAVSTWRPKLVYGTIQLVENQSKYLEGTDYNIVSVDFVDKTPAPADIYYGNLISPAPLAMRGMEEYVIYMNWRKTWMRVMSMKPDWLMDRTNKILWIYNPISRYQAGIVAYGSYTLTQDLPLYEADWVKKYSTQKSREQLGELYSKFSGAVPGPAQSLMLDQQKRQLGADSAEKLLQRLQDSQELTPISID